MNCLRNIAPLVFLCRPVFAQSQFALGQPALGRAGVKVPATGQVMTIVPNGPVLNMLMLSPRRIATRIERRCRGTTQDHAR